MEINISNLAGVPSIIYGLLGLQIFVRLFGLGHSVLAGSLTLSLLILPIIIVATRESIKAVPQSLRDASYALGATKWQTIRNVVLPPATQMITSGTIISIGRTIGETAAVIFTAGYFAHITTSLLHPVGSLSNFVYSGFELSIGHEKLLPLVYSASFIIIVIIIILNTISKIIYLKAKWMK